MPRKAKEPALTDRERILTTIVSQLSSTQLLAKGNPSHDPRAADFSSGSQLVHFAYYRKPEKGDLVIGKTGRIDRWKIGYFEQGNIDGYGTSLIREIGSGLLCNYGNEEFVPILGLRKSDLYEGDEYQFYVKVRRAFGKGDEYMYRFGGVDFEGDNAVIWIREAFGGLSLKNPSKPFSVRMQWNKRTSVKKILEIMRAGGYGTREFEPGDPKGQPESLT